MKIHAYKVVARGDLSLDQVLDHLTRLPLADRLRTVSGGAIRLEAGNKGGQIWSLDFAGIRPEGPGRASPSLPISDFDLTDDEGFGEETGAVFNANSGFMALQFNSRGPRNGRISGYLLRHARVIVGLVEDVPNDADHGFALAPVIKQDSLERLGRAALIKKFRVSVFVPGLAHIDEPRRQSLTGILANPVVGSAANLNLQIRAGRKKRSTLNVPAIRTMAEELLALGDGVEALEAVIRESEEGANEPIDLLQARLEADVRVSRTGRRYARNERWAALRTTLDSWAAEGQLA